VKLHPNDRDVIHAILAEAHVPGRPTREIAAHFAAAVRDLEPSGLPWVSTYLEELVIVGAQKVCADWRRSQNGKAKTKKGTDTPVPAFVGQNDAATGTAVQLTFDDLDLDGVRRHRQRLAAQRNTLSTTIQYLADLVEVMESDESIATAGDAATVLRERAA